MDDGASIGAEGVDGVHGIPQGQRHELDLVFDMAAGDVGAAISGNAVEAGQDCLLQHGMVSISVLRGCIAMPHAKNHDELLQKEIVYRDSCRSKHSGAVCLYPKKRSCTHPLSDKTCY